MSCTYTNSLSETVFSVKPLFRRFKRFEKSLYGLNTDSLSETVFSVKPLFRRFKRFEKSFYDLKRPIFESELVLGLTFPVIYFMDHSEFQIKKYLFQKMEP